VPFGLLRHWHSVTTLPRTGRLGSQGTKVL
jgi:hypothetical protein